MKQTYLFIILFIGMNLFYSCLEDPDGPEGIVNGKKPEMGADSIGIVTATTIEVFAEIEQKNGSAVTEYGFLYKKADTDEPETVVPVGNDNETMKFAIVLSDLQKHTNYFIRSYAINAVDTGFSKGTIDVTDPGIGRAETFVNHESVTATTILVGGKIERLGEGDIISKGIYYSEHADMSEKDSFLITSPINENKFEGVLSNLKPSTTYYIQAFVRNSFGFFTGPEVEQATTTDGKPKLGDLMVVDRDFTFTEFGVTILEEGDAPVEEWGFYWWIEEDLKEWLAGSEPLVQIEGGLYFKGRLEDLEEEIPYYVLAYATNQYGTSYTEDTLTFYKLTEHPVVETYRVSDSDKEKGTVKVGGSILDIGSSPVINAGICWSKTEKFPTIENSDTINLYLDENVFEGIIHNLRGETTYYIRAFAINEDEYIGYGDTASFKTPKIFVQMADFPGSNSRWQGSSGYISIGDNGYLLGGDLGNNFINEFWKYNAENNEWDSGLGNFNPGGRKGQALAYMETSKTLYAFGGMKEGHSLTSDLYYYNFSSSRNEWLEYPVSTLPDPLYMSVGVSLGDSVYFIGGSQQGLITNETWMYDVDHRFESKASLPVRQYGGVAVAIDNIIYAGLGMTNNDGSTFNNTLYSSVNYLNSWQTETTFPGNSVIRSGVAHENLLYIIDDSKTIWVYNPEGKTWMQKSTIAPHYQYPDYIWSLNGYLYIGMGRNASHGTNTTKLLKYDPSWDN